MPSSLRIKDLFGFDSSLHLLRPDSSFKSKQPITWAVIEVEDSGSGISPEDQAKLFNRFQQGQHQRTGSGLGLHLSRYIVEAHQGEIEVHSELGKGELLYGTVACCSMRRAIEGAWTIPELL